MGPTIESDPTQKSRIPVESPSARFVRENRFTNRLKRPSRSHIVPTNEPNAKLAINSTGYWLSGKCVTTAFAPNTMVAKPNALYKADW